MKGKAQAESVHPARERLFTFTSLGHEKGQEQGRVPTIMFKRLGQGSTCEEAPVSALMFKRLGQEARKEQPPIPAIVFTQPIPALMFKRLAQEAKKEQAPIPALVFTQPIPATTSRKPRRSHHGSALQPTDGGTWKHFANGAAVYALEQRSLQTDALPLPLLKRRQSRTGPSQRHTEQRKGASGAMLAPDEKDSSRR